MLCPILVRGPAALRAYRSVQARFPLLAPATVLFLAILAAPVLSGKENLQSFVDAVMEGHTGAIIASDPRGGQVLAIWNSEAVFDLTFPPGSTAKVVECAALLEEEKVSISDRIYCRRVPELLGESFHCSHPLKPLPLDLRSALAHSCNYFLAAMSLRLPVATLAHWYGAFGFGTAVEGWERDGNAGLVRIPPDATGKARAALGEGGVLATPAQLLLAYSAIATRGKVFRLRQPGRPSRRAARLLREIRLSPLTFDVLNAGLEQCVREGTGQAAGVAGVRVAGKTGTASSLSRTGATHAWFVGYAPVEDPEIVLVVFLERGTGARDAAPLAGEILRFYFQTKNQER